MGKRSRDKRAREKKLASELGFKENEFGELQAVTTKAEARRRFLWSEFVRRVIEPEIIDAMVKQAHDDICELEDARVFAMLDESIQGAPSAGP
jgi:hypothetical protein